MKLPSAILATILASKLLSHELGITAFPGTAFEIGPQLTRGELTSYSYYINKNELIGYEEYHKNGKPKRQDRYHNGKLNGTCYLWYGNGTLERRIQYKNGLLEGEWHDWSSDGTLEGVSHFLKGSGIRKRSYPNGSMKSTETYAAGALNGPWIEYYLNGQVSNYILYKSGNSVGISVGFREDGSIKIWGQYDDDGRLSGKLVRKGVDGSITADLYVGGNRIWTSGEGVFPPPEWQDELMDLTVLYKKLPTPEIPQ